MCGIAGIINFHGSDPNIVDQIKAMLQRISHRGPDDEGILIHDDETDIYFTNDSQKFHSSLPYIPDNHIDSRNSKSGRIAFGHRRLSIIDITADGHQPMSDPSGRYWMIYNGEIYNYLELKSELQAAGYKFRTKTDSEVLLQAYIHWGEACLDKFNGMWSFAIFDQHTKEIFAARDRLGIKPFNYYLNNKQFVFCSEIKGILASGLYQPEIDYEGLWYNMAQGVAPRPLTCFKNVVSLKPGHKIKVKPDGNVCEEKYWELPLNVEQESLGEDEILSNLHEIISSSINYRLRADVKVGSFLSGGVDSGIVTSIASQMLPNISGYTIGFKEAGEMELNEIDAASNVAKKHNINHITKVVDGDHMLSQVNNMVNCFEEPYLSLTPPFIAAELAKENNAKVVLYGMGGDEFFGGYRYYKRIPLWKFAQKNSWVLNMLPNGISGKIDRFKQLGACKNVWEYYSMHHNNITDQEKQLFFKDGAWNTADGYKTLFDSKDFRKSSTFDQLSYVDTKTYLSSHQLTRNDQFAMFFSIEGRFPFLDHRLVEQAFRIDSDLKLKNNSTKYLLKKIAEPYLPHDQIYQKKKGFTFPMQSWCNTSFKSLINDSINSLEKRNIFDNKGINKTISKEGWQKKWHLVMTELWLQNFFDK